MSRPNDPAMCPVCRTRNCQTGHDQVGALGAARRLLRVVSSGRERREL